jgi:hypothetical protein
MDNPQPKRPENPNKVLPIFLEGIYRSQVAEKAFPGRKVAVLGGKIVLKQAEISTPR